MTEKLTLNDIAPRETPVVDDGLNEPDDGLLDIPEFIRRPKRVRKKPVRGEPVDLSTIVIDKNKPVERRRGRNGALRSPWLRTLEQLDVGDSFLVRGRNVIEMGYLRRLAKRALGITLALKNESNGCRIGRVEDDDGLGS